MSLIRFNEKSFVHLKKQDRYVLVGLQELDGDHYFEIKGVSMAFFETILQNSRTTIDDLHLQAERIARDFDVPELTVLKDLENFLAELETNQIIAILNK